MTLGAISVQENIVASINYATADAERQVFYRHAPERSVFSEELVPTAIANGRRATDLSLDTNGFLLATVPTQVTDFYDDEQVRKIYYGETCDLVRKLTGAADVVLLHGAVRDEGPDARSPRRPARGAHIDYDEPTVRLRIAAEVGAERASELLKRRFSAINVWRPIRTVESTPLAICDGRTIRREDLVESVIADSPDRPLPPYIGYHLRHHAGQRWYYFPLMRPDELLAFRLIDSDPERTQLTAHSAFDDPGSAPDARPRASYEIRTVAFF